MRSAIKASVTIAIGIALATILGGCSLLPLLAPAPTPTPTGESASAACDALEDEAAALSGELSEASELLSADETGAAEMLAAAAVRFEKAAASVENEEVKELAKDTSDSLTLFSGLINVLAADPANPDEDALESRFNSIHLFLFLI